MDFIIKRGMGGVKQIGVKIENEPDGLAVLATFANTYAQRQMIALFTEGVLSGGHTLYDANRQKWLVGDVGQLTNHCPDCEPDKPCGRGTCCNG